MGTGFLLMSWVPILVDEAGRAVAGRIVETVLLRFPVFSLLCSSDRPKSSFDPSWLTLEPLVGVLIGDLTTVSIDLASSRGDVVPLLPAIGLNSGSTTELHPSPPLFHLTFLLRSAFSASLSCSHLRIFSALRFLLARSYASLLSWTAFASGAKGELALAELIEGVSTSISPVEGLTPCTPR